MKFFTQLLTLAVFFGSPVAFAGEDLSSNLYGDYENYKDGSAYPEPQGEWTSEGQLYSENGEDREALKKVPLHENEIVYVTANDIFDNDILSDIFGNFVNDLENNHDLKLYIQNPKYHYKFKEKLQEKLKRLGKINLVDALEICDNIWDETFKDALKDYQYCAQTRGCGQNDTSNKYQCAVFYSESKKKHQLFLWNPVTAEKKLLYENNAACKDLNFTMTPDKKAIIVIDYATYSTQSCCSTRSDFYLIDLDSEQTYPIDQNLANAKITNIDNTTFTISYLQVNYGRRTKTYEIKAKGNPRVICGTTPYHGLGLENQSNYLYYL